MGILKKIVVGSIAVGAARLVLTSDAKKPDKKRPLNTAAARRAATMALAAGGSKPAKKKASRASSSRAKGRAPRSKTA